MIASLTGQVISVQHALRTLGVSESGYYDWKGRPDSPTALRPTCQPDSSKTTPSKQGQITALR